MVSPFHPLHEKQLAYFKTLQQQLDARKVKVSSVSARRNFLQKQKTANYTNELNRLRGVYLNTNVKTTKDIMQKRMEHLKTLGGIAVDSIQD